MSIAATAAARAKSRHDLFLAAGLGLLALIAWACVTPFGGWVQSFFYGSGVRWQNAYAALDTAEMNLPRNERERERLLLATALTEGEPPLGMKIGPRLHPVGTLAQLRYELFDENGAPMDQWEVRALVPNIGNGEGPFWREPCRKACRDEDAQSSGTHLRRSGEAGIAEELVLRMPVGETFNLKPAPLTTQDILDTRARRIGLGSVKVGTQTVPVPSKVLVTLVKACAGNVRVGTAMNFEFNESAMIPYPRGFVVSRWAELDGCGKLEPYDPPPAAPAVTPARIAADPPDLHAVIARRDPQTGFATLNVDEAWLRTHNMPVVFQLNLVCRYDPATDQWQRIARPDPRSSWRLVPQTAGDGALGNRVVFELPREIGLYWVHWAEQKEVNAAARQTVYRETLALSGPVQCNDISMDAPAPGRIAACVPFPSHAEARFVPKPEKPCTQ